MQLLPLLLVAYILLNSDELHRVPSYHTSFRRDRSRYMYRTDEHPLQASHLPSRRHHSLPRYNRLAPTTMATHNTCSSPPPQLHRSPSPPVSHIRSMTVSARSPARSSSRKRFSVLHPFTHRVWGASGVGHLINLDTARRSKEESGRGYEGMG